MYAAFTAGLRAPIDHSLRACRRPAQCSKSWQQTARPPGPIKKQLHSVGAWRLRWRYLRAQRQLGTLPPVDWERFHLNILVVDRNDAVLAKLVCGLLERIAEWNGAGRILLPFTRGTATPTWTGVSVATSAALFSQAARLRLRAKVFSKAPELFDAADWDLYDVIVAVDTETKEQMLACAEPPELRPHYAGQVAVLTAFLPYCGTELLSTGGSGVLDSELRDLVAPGGRRGRLADPQGIGLPPVSLSGDPADWAATVRTAVVACAGLTQYMLDSYPPDLPDYDPV